MKVSQDRRACSHPDWGVRRVFAKPRNDALLFFQKGEIGWGRNSGFQAINLALQFGAKRIALCGFDYAMHRGTHWHGRHPAGLNNPSESAISAWRQILDAQADLLRARGIELFIATPDSRLTAYERRPLMELLDELSLSQHAA